MRYWNEPSASERREYLQQHLGLMHHITFDISNYYLSPKGVVLLTLATAFVGLSTFGVVGFLVGLVGGFLFHNLILPYILKGISYPFAKRQYRYYEQLLMPNHSQTITSEQIEESPNLTPEISTLTSPPVTPKRDTLNQPEPKNTAAAVTPEREKDTPNPTQKKAKRMMPFEIESP